MGAAVRELGAALGAMAATTLGVLVTGVFFGVALVAATGWARALW